MFQALADPARRLMMERLSRGPASVSELAEPFDMSLSAVAQHIRLLQASGLIASEKTGRVRTCRIEPKALRDRRAVDHRTAHGLGTPLRPARRVSGEQGKIKAERVRS